jgi:hypothetical protein
VVKKTAHHLPFLVSLRYLSSIVPLLFMARKLIQSDKYPTMQAPAYLYRISCNWQQSYFWLVKLLKLKQLSMITLGFSRSVATAAASGSQRTASLRLQLTGSSTGSSLAERTPGVRLREQPRTPVSRHPAALPQGRQFPVLGIRIHRIRSVSQR